MARHAKANVVYPGIPYQPLNALISERSRSDRVIWTGLAARAPCTRTSQHCKTHSRSKHHHEMHKCKWSEVLIYGWWTKLSNTMVRLSFWARFSKMYSPRRAGKRTSPNDKNANVGGWHRLYSGFQQLPHAHSMQKMP